jgi:hypothetical protein
MYVIVTHYTRIIHVTIFYGRQSVHITLILMYVVYYRTHLRPADEYS